MRPVGLLLFPGSLLVVALAAVACSSAQPPLDYMAGANPSGDSTPAPKRTSTTGPKSDTCLGKVGLGYEKSTCDACMSADGCCQATIACFKGNAECSALQDCMSACGGGTGTGPGTGGGDAGTMNTVAKGIFVNEVFPSLNGTCGGCHGKAGPGPQFFGATADLTYPMFKIAGFDKPNSTLVLKGAHEGPALTAAQKTIITKWVNAEAAPPPGGGDGGGGGAGTGGGKGDGGGGDGGGGDKSACQAACKTKHPTALDKWNAYNTCVSSTCGSSCL
jgi:hypothetical protein